MHIWPRDAVAEVLKSQKFTQAGAAAVERQMLSPAGKIVTLSTANVYVAVLDVLVIAIWTTLPSNQRRAPSTKA